MSDYTISSLDELRAITEEGDGYYVLRNGNLIITRNIECPGLIVYEGSLTCQGSYSSNGFFKAESLEVSGDFSANEAYIPSGDVNVGGNCNTPHILNTMGNANIGGDVYTGSFYAESIIVGGNLGLSGIVVSRNGIRVGGGMTCLGYIVSNDGDILVGENIFCASYITCSSGRVVAGYTE